MSNSEKAADILEGAVAQRPQGPPSDAQVSPTRKDHSFKKFYYNNEKTILGLLGIVLMLAIWELVARLQLVDVMFVSSPTRVWAAGVDYVTVGNFLNDLRASGVELFFGLGLSIVIGIPLGIALGWYRKLYYLLDPLVSFLYASPRIALVSLFIIWFGIGIGSKVAVIFLSAIFPIIINTLIGVKTIDHNLLNVARSFNANDAQIFKTVVIPSSVPAIISGIRLALGHALIGVVVGELFAATEGIGYMMITAGQTFQTDLVFVGLIIIAGLGVILTGLIHMVERRFDKWRVDVRK